MANNWFLYIIQAKSGKLYTGITTDLERRFLEHQNKQGAKFFRSSAPLRIVYTENFKFRSEASKRESAIKKMTRQEKLKLVAL